MEIYMIYTTTKDGDEARRIGEHLVKQGLAACVNIFDRMNSIYTWEGALQHDTEAVMIAKTVKAKVTAIIETVREMHSYDCPCVLALPVADGNPDFMGWIAGQVAV
jgi:periplasmic divalent cation tolerance protein